MNQDENLQSKTVDSGPSAMGTEGAAAEAKPVSFNEYVPEGDAAATGKYTERSFPEPGKEGAINPEPAEKAEGASVNLAKAAETAAAGSAVTEPVNVAAEEIAPAVPVDSIVIVPDNTGSGSASGAFTAAADVPPSAAAEPVKAAADMTNNAGNINAANNPESPAYSAHIPPEPPKRAKKGSFWKKALAAIVIGLLFGVCVGAGMYAFRFMPGVDKGNSKVDRTKPVNTAEVSTEAEAALNSDESEAATEEASMPVAAVDESGDKASEAEKETEEEPEERGRSFRDTGDGRNGGSIRSTSPKAAPGNGYGDVSAVVEEVMPAVVSITNDLTVVREYFGQKYSQEAKAAGSGIIVGDDDDELLIVTNQHVVSDADTLGVQFIDGTEAEANLKGEDEDTDIAVIAVPKSALSEKTLSDIRVATLGDSNSLKVGQATIAIGNAMGYGQSVTTGVVSALDREVKLDNGSHKLIQTDAAINPGNSGGALLDINGYVIGINEAKLASSEIEGMGYAIPISTAKPVIELLQEQNTKIKANEDNRGYLGISGIDITADVAEQYHMPRGVYIEKVGEGLAADKAGLKKGDIITKFDEQTIQTMSQLQNLIAYYEKGQTINVTIQEPEEEGYGYKERVVSVTLGEAMTDVRENQDSEPKDNNNNDFYGDDWFFNDGWGFGMW